MRFFITTLIACCSVLALTAQNASDPIPYYIADSILPYMPLHKSNQDSLKSYQLKQQEQTVQLEALRKERADEIKKDSAVWSPLLLQVKKTQLRQIDDNIIAYKQYSVTELHLMDSTFRADEIKIIHAAALVVIAQKGWKEVYENAQMHDVLEHAPTGAMTYDITELVLQEMKLK